MTVISESHSMSITYINQDKKKKFHHLMCFCHLQMNVLQLGFPAGLYLVGLNSFLLYRRDENWLSSHSTSETSPVPCFLTEGYSSCRLQPENERVSIFCFPKIKYREKTI